MKKVFHFAFLITFGYFAVGCGDPSVEYQQATETSAPQQVFVMSLFSDAAGITMTNAAAAGTELAGNVSRAHIDFSAFTMVRAHFASSLTSATVACRIEYSTNNGSSWATLISNFAASTSANANNNSSWTSIPTGARGEILLRALIVGDGALDPIIKYVRLSFY